MVPCGQSQYTESSNGALSLATFVNEVEVLEEDN